MPICLIIAYYIACEWSESVLTSWFHCCQADTCIQSAGSRRWLQTSSENVTIHSAEQHAAERPGSQLCVGQHRQFKPGLRERLTAAPSGAEQRGGKPHRAVQHHQWIHPGRHTWRSIIRKHIATRQQALTDVSPPPVTAYCAPTESCGNSIRHV